MNSIVIHGKVKALKDNTIVKDKYNREFPLLVFTMTDWSLPYANKDPLSIDVHCMRGVVPYIAQYIKPGKEVVVHGWLSQKNNKYYVSAQFVTLTPLDKNKDIPEV